ncbi:cupin domain-containing protein [Caldimonas sp. KR1-144]|uniref:cupin domain-containing protein n=1 Tax=Caldimonas sp. KR1-144 TaxID=3400911 RepID=UPI003C0F046D
MTTTPEAERLRALLVRNFNDVPLERQLRDPLYDSRCGGLSDGTAARKLGAAIDVVPPGKRSCPYHLHHAQEEMFIVIEGEGTLRVAGEMVPIRAGDVIFIPPGKDYPHHIINTSEAPLKYLSISTKEKPEICEYPDSGKVMAWAPGVDLLNRPGINVDYWDGEP